MDDIFVYCVNLPSGVHEMVVPCADGYTVYLNALESEEQQEKAFKHVLKHINHNDHQKDDVQQIEADAHRKEKE